jgi:hypothetical protein
MSHDPWSRPTVEDLKRILESIGKLADGQNRSIERIELAVPAEITTTRGNVVPAMTREISRVGIGFIHRGFINPAEVTVKLASETREFEYKVRLEWCDPADNGMFLSGGRFLGRVS